MALIPRWQFMTDEAKGLVRTIGVSVVGLLLVLLVLRFVGGLVSGLLLPLALVFLLVFLLKR